MMFRWKGFMIAMGAVSEILIHRVEGKALITAFLSRIYIAIGNDQILAIFFVLSSSA